MKTHNVYVSRLAFRTKHIAPVKRWFVEVVLVLVVLGWFLFLLLILFSVTLCSTQRMFYYTCEI
jgi:hypothetical protein